ncbi:unnamed protein product [Ambrosiozyma monospora]|uniref:Unnamed protein product n=1 Tax=Ambrosiozyma monospora TaxID=43982 RepID=A0ACB5TB48_AMBMO|nr:unnamed protein product [Ambrosiozyma monospora]
MYISIFGCTGVLSEFYGRPDRHSGGTFHTNLEQPIKPTNYPVNTIINMNLSNSLAFTILTTIAIGRPIKEIDESVQDIEKPVEEIMNPNESVQTQAKIMDEEYTSSNEFVSFGNLNRAEMSSELEDFEFDSNADFESSTDYHPEHVLEELQSNEPEVSVTNQGRFPIKKKKKTTVWNIGPKIVGAMLGRSNRASSKGKDKSKGKGNSWSWPGSRKGKTNGSDSIGNGMNGNAPDDDSDAMAIITLNIGDFDKPTSSDGAKEASTTLVSVVKRAAAGDVNTVTTTGIGHENEVWTVDGFSFTSTTLDTSFASTVTGSGGSVESTDFFEFSGLSWPLETTII